jgi:hypothetical protein
MSEHSIAKAIRTVGAQICRRLDVLIEAAGKPPVIDIEGTSAPRHPLAHAAAQKKEQPVAALSPAPAAAMKKEQAVAALSPAPALPGKRGRGRPPKNKIQANDQTPITFESFSGSDDNEESSHTDTAEVSAIYFSFLFVFTNTWQVVFCPEHQLFSLIHGEENYMKETYTDTEMLAFDVTEDELVSAKSEADKKAKLLATNVELRKESKCICFPWVRIFFAFYCRWYF